MENLLIENASAVFAIVGALVGSIVTGVFGYYGKSREVKLKLAEKIIGKKLDAHEKIIDFANVMRVMCVVEGVPVDKELPRYPAFLHGKESFDKLWNELGEIQSQSERWLSAELKREIYFSIDYLVTLYKWVEQVNDVGLRRLGVVLRNDIVDISNRIEEKSHEFINNDIVNLKIKTDRRWHKFESAKTEKMFQNTILMKRRSELQGIVDGEIT